jgi:membrane protein implicated in regulation of membrane protease activity
MWLGIAVFCTGWFVIQFLLSVIFGLDSDIDVDTSGDFDASDLLSFKGLIHFGIGYSWWMVIHSQNTSWSTHAVAFLLGSLVMIVLWLTYLGISKLKKEIIPERGEALVGKSGVVYAKDLITGEYTVTLEINGAMREIQSVESLGENPKPGQTVIIKEYKDGKYFIN